MIKTGAETKADFRREKESEASSDQAKGCLSEVSLVKGRAIVEKRNWL